MQTQPAPGDNRAVGIGMWLFAGVSAFLVARVIPGPRGSWLVELMVAIVVALLQGVVATALDFGGWSELDWRAGTFAFLGALAVIGVVRAIRR